MTLKVHNTLSGQFEEFQPINDSKVGMYVCGINTYDDSHMGHAKSAVTFDVIRRYLERKGYDVTYVINFTDIEDHCIARTLELGIPLDELTERYIGEYHKDMGKLGVRKADVYPVASHHMAEIIAAIQKLIDRGFAYESGGEVYFNVTKVENFGVLSNRKLEEMQAGARIAVDERKKNPWDFVLWKNKKPDEPFWESPWSEGRPGWHTECSAMIDRYLAYKDEEYAIDIHGGGADLFFPHHENEAAQTRCATRQKLAKYWMHNGFVNINGEKMSKSLGNSFFVKDALKFYDGEILRYYLLSTHYRANFNFNEEDLLSSKKRLDKIYRLKKRLYGAKSASADKGFREEVLAALADDLNISRALAAVDEMVAKANEYLDGNPKDKAFKQKTLANIEWIHEVMGFGGKDAYRYFQLGMSEEEIARINELIEARDVAKKARDFETADAIRAELAEMGIQLMDTPEGTVWEKSE